MYSTHAGRLRSHPGTTDVWVGLRAAPDAWVWAWEDRTPVSYLYWERGYPEWGASDRCVTFEAASGRMTNGYCTRLTNYICKKKGLCLAPTSYALIAASRFVMRMLRFSS